MTAPLATAAEVAGAPTAAELPSGRAIYLGLIDYAAAWHLQLRLLEERTADRCPDTLLLCQHPSVITVGRRQLATQNIREPRFPIFEVERGGDATYHGPGQLVGYPILKLRPPADGALTGGERDLHRYLRRLEEALIDLCADCGVIAGRRAGATGVWTAPTAAASEEPASPDPSQRKLASLGIAVRRWVSFHGFALNVTTDLSAFYAINPCGFASSVMTSLATCGGRPPAPHREPLSVEVLLTRAIEHLGHRLGRQFSEVAPAVLAPLLSAE